MDYKEALAYIGGVAFFGSKPGLTRIRELLERLGDPQKQLRFIHIAGTNGKGSCAAMTASILKAAGYKTGLYTSPYLYRFNERMQINGRQIEDEALAEIVSRVKPAAEAMADHPTEVELMTAAALLWYAQEKCDVVVLEVGLGGRFDATNIIDAPEAAVIMNIGLDHTAVLGDTLEQIAFEKAGIIKPGTDAVLFEQGEEATGVVRRRCEELGVPLHIADFSQLVSEFDSLYGQSFTYRGLPYALPLLGAHQLKNAAVVLELVEVLREKGVGRAVFRRRRRPQPPVRRDRAGQSPALFPGQAAHPAARRPEGQGLPRPDGDPRRGGGRVCLHHARERAGPSGGGAGGASEALRQARHGLRQHPRRRDRGAEALGRRQRGLRGRLALLRGRDPRLL